MKIDNEELEYVLNSAISFRMLYVKNYPPHFHDNAIELLYCINGSVTVVSSDIEFTMNSGDIFTFDPHDIHCMFSDEENLVISVCIDPTRLNIHDEKIGYYFFNCDTNELSNQQIEPMYLVKDILLFLALFTPSSNNDNTTIYQKAAEKLLNILINHFSWFDANSSFSDDNPFLKERLFRITDYCYKNCAKKITISQLALMEHLNESYFSNFMRKTSYGGFTHMINYMRCYRAEIMLLTTNMNILDISSACGFSDPKYFYSNFYKWWKRTPAQHRKMFENYCKRSIEIEIIPSHKISALLNDFMSNYHFTKMLDLANL